MRDYGFSPLQQDQIWRQWRDGRSLSSITRGLNAPMQHVRRLIAQTGGIRQRPPQRSLRHLTIDEREDISRGIVAGQSARLIARQLGRAASSISREITRNGGRANYWAQRAEAMAELRSRRPKPAKLARYSQLRALIEQKLTLHWSPQQTTGWLRRTYPHDALMWISHEIIYISLYDPRRHAIDRRLTRLLRTSRPMRYPRVRRPSGMGRLRDMVCISARPAEVNNRGVPGHWEGDLMMGRRPSAISTLVERISRYVRLFALPKGIKAEQLRPYLTQAMLDIPPRMRHSVTWDRGREMAEHSAFTGETGMQVYFCTPRSPWQRGTNENTNGLLRQYLAKGADLRKLSQHHLDAIADELNNRPRKLHGFRSPADVYAELLQESGASMG